MNNVKKLFSIKDLENLSGIKAHTIRIWEKRYNLLSPDRTDTNIRKYSLESLQKLLNITMLYNNGYKISKIAHLSENEIPLAVQNLTKGNGPTSQAVNAFKMAMVNFDSKAFYDTYDTLLEEHSFRAVFFEIFIPLLNELGLLWQTDSISPVNEHFITGLIKQKIILNIEKVRPSILSKMNKPYVLYLPENEIHEIGLLYLNYEIISSGHQSIYLGQTVPLENLRDLMKRFPEAIFISYFTIVPTQDSINSYIHDFGTMAKEEGSEAKLWLLGSQTQYLENQKLPSFMRTFHSIEQVTNQL